MVHEISTTALALGTTSIIILSWWVFRLHQAVSEIKEKYDDHSIFAERLHKKNVEIDNYLAKLDGDMKSIIEKVKKIETREGPKEVTPILNEKQFQKKEKRKTYLNK